MITAISEDELDSLAPLWGQLVAHHGRESTLTARWAMESGDDSWRRRRAQYAAWLREPHTVVLVEREGAAQRGYAVVRVVESAGAWSWGTRVGSLETLVVDADVRGGGVGRALLDRARAHLAGLGVEAMQIVVMDGNTGALRFYRRAGAIAALTTLMLPVAEG